MRECDQRVDISCREGGSRREGLLLGTENLFHKFQKNASFYLNTRNPSTVQLELLSGNVDFLRPTKSLGEEKDS